MKACLFTNTPDEHFVINRLDGGRRVSVAAGFSGHGFKFCSVVGEVLADLALDGGTRHDISLFSLSRLPIAFHESLILLSHMSEKADVWQGTLALMVLKTLETLGPLHGYGIARRIEQTSGDGSSSTTARSTRRC